MSKLWGAQRVAAKNTCNNRPATPNDTKLLGTHKINRQILFGDSPAPRHPKHTKTFAKRLIDATDCRERCRRISGAEASPEKITQTNNTIETQWVQLSNDVEDSLAPTPTRQRKNQYKNYRGSNGSMQRIHPKTLRRQRPTENTKTKAYTTRN